MQVARSLSFPAFRRTARVGIGHMLAAVWRVVSTRQRLAELDDRMLKDLGVSRAQAQFEISRPVWKMFR